MWKDSRTRSLAEINRKIAKRSRRIEEMLGGLAAQDRPLSVLEVGFGQGRALTELAWMFRDRPIEFHGVDVIRRAPVECSEDLRDVARHFEIVPEAALADFRVPQLDFYDATRLRFEDESLDFIYSAVTIRFFERKAEFLEEVCRVLRPGGRAMLHLGESHWNYPYSIAADARILTPYTNRFVLKHGDELIPLPVYVKLFESERFRFNFTPDTRCIVTVSKLAAGRLAFDLDYNERLSMSGTKVPLLNRKGVVCGGFRSVYDVRPEYYRALFAEGLLSREHLRTDIVLRPSA